MIKIISFDIGGTLLFNDNEDNKNYDLRSLSTLLNLPYDNVRDAYKKIYQKSNGSFDFLLESFCKELGILPFDELREFFINKFNSSASKISRKDVELLKKLKKDGYKIIFFSNSCALIDNDFDDEIYSIIDKIYYSYEIGFTKSDSEAYRIIEREMGVNPDEILHIGDTLNSDYIKPISNGWNAIYFGKCDDENIECIEDLNELEGILKDK